MRNRVTLFCLAFSLSVSAQNPQTGEKNQNTQQLKVNVNHSAIQCRQTYRTSATSNVSFKLRSRLELDPSFAPVMKECHQWEYKDAQGVCRDKPGTLHCTDNCPQRGYECWDWCLCREGQYPGSSSCAPCQYQYTVCTPD